MTDIEWTDKTWNCIVGCARVSAGCQNCYAERVAHRGMTPTHKGLTVMGKHGPRWTGEVRCLPERLGEPLRGESGPGARPCDVDWVRSIVRQCGEAGAACFVKQLGARPLAAMPDLREWGPGVGWVGAGSEPGPLRLRDRKGGDMDEWPSDMRVRRWPEVDRGE